MKNPIKPINHLKKQRHKLKKKRIRIGEEIANLPGEPPRRIEFDVLDLPVGGPFEITACLFRGQSPFHSHGKIGSVFLCFRTLNRLSPDTHFNKQKLSQFTNRGSVQ